MPERRCRWLPAFAGMAMMGLAGANLISAIGRKLSLRTGRLFADHIWLAARVDPPPAPPFQGGEAETAENARLTAHGRRPPLPSAAKSLTLIVSVMRG